MKSKVTFNPPQWCNYDQVYKITWTIETYDGKKLLETKTSNNFSTRGNRIGQIIAKQQQTAEFVEATKRLDIVKRYLEAEISRKKAIEEMQELKFLCPKNPTAHLATMLELTLGLR